MEGKKNNSDKTHAASKIYDYFCNYTDKQQLVVKTGGKQLVVNQDRNIPKKKCMGSQPLGIKPKASDLSCQRSDH